MHSDQQVVHDALRERILTGNERIKVDALKKVKLRVEFSVSVEMSTFSIGVKLPFFKKTYVYQIELRQITLQRDIKF